MDLRTKAVHTGVSKDTTFNSATTPIYTSSTFRFNKLGSHSGYDYTRTANPTRTALEENLADLEGGIGSLATATGMAAIAAVMFLLKPGDHVVTGSDIYGGTYRLFSDIFTRWGVSFSFINMMDLNEIRKAVRPETKMIWIETPSNPLLHIVDLEGTIAIAKEKKLLSVVDNTFLSPYFQKPFAFGADLIVHSTTKYLNGHSDVVGGAIIWKDAEIGKQIRFLGNAMGLGEAPFDAWLVLRGVKTLVPRMEIHQANAMKIAQFLESHPNVKKVYYPGLKSHPQQALIKKQMSGFGGMLAFELNTSRVSLDKFFSKMKLFTLAESLGGVESLIEHPGCMSHASMGEAGLAASGITPETIRVSVGIEAAEDLIAELKTGLENQ